MRSFTATITTGLLGWPVQHSLSPAMHNAAAAALGLDFVYVPLPVLPEDLGAAVAGLRALGFRGANVTIPHKQAVMPFLDEIDAAAQAIGAVNTIVVDPDDGHRHGYNTDYTGFLADLRQHGVAPAGQRALILGAGGAARAVVYALGLAGARLHILARRPGQAEALAAGLAPHLPGVSLEAGSLRAAGTLDDVSLIVNTTPVGMAPTSTVSPWPEGAPLPGGAFVYDLVYNPLVTRLMRQARGDSANGLGMLVQQGALAFSLWTGRQPNQAVMRAAALAALAP